MRLVVETDRAIRAALGPDFPVGIKLNSADFQQRGFSEADSMEVVQALAREGVDLVEISGGTYDSPAMVGAGLPQPGKASTRQREAYCLAYAETVRKLVDQMTFLAITWYEYQLARIGDGKRSLPRMNAWRSVLSTLWGLGMKGLAKRRA